MKSSFSAALLLLAALGLGVPLQAVEIKVEDATVADLQAAFAKGTLTSEKLTDIFLARISAYDKSGPAINAVITLNPKAIEEAKALDAERAAGHVRGPLHGIPIVLKDNYNTYDLPTTAGSQMLEGSIPPADSFMVKKLRDAGAIILAKVNLSEWAAGGGSVNGAKDPKVIEAGRVPMGFSSMGLQTLNPHDLTRTPSGSSGGTGAAIAATFAQFGLGTDTGGSIRGPSSANGLAGLKPTRGLVSRAGIVPLALSFDTGGPIARSVYDVAVSLGIMTGVDPKDPATEMSKGHFKKDYTPYLKKGSLKGARIGVARDFMGQDAGTDAVMEKAFATLKELGAEVIDVHYPDYLLVAKQALSAVISPAEFRVQVTEYLQTLKPGYPRSFDELVAKANDPAFGYRSPGKAYGFKYQQATDLAIDDPRYLAAKNEGLALVKAGILAIFKEYKLDAIVYPTMPTPAPLIDAPAASGGGGAASATAFANQTGFPDLIVPAGVTDSGLPVTISFFGVAWSEPKLLGYGYDFEQATHARINPKYTPVLPGDTISY